MLFARVMALCSVLATGPSTLAQDEAPPEKALPIPGEVFRVNGRTAFVIPAEKIDSPDATDRDRRTPWVWYAPTLPNLPGQAERWMFERITKAGIAVAGIDVGESFGSPDGRKLFTAFHRELTEQRGFSTKPVLLGRSRGGLMTLGWAVENPDKVGGFAGIYPVCNITSYPGIARASGAYGLTEVELTAQLSEHNPIDRLASLARAKVPLFAIHGDVDKVVPLDDNSGEVRRRYEKLGGAMQLIVPAGEGHNMWPGFFQSQELVAFVIAHARPARSVRVFILAGQSNMEGQAVADLTGKDYNGGRGTLHALLDNPARAPLVRHLRAADGTWTVRDDVWCRYRRERGTLLAGPLTMGFSVYGDSHHFGPELQFGHVLGEHCENPVLLIKTAWGGKSLYKDFRPPSSGGEVGPYYLKMIAEVREALANLKADFPNLAGRETELAGFVWYHGWNDGVDPKNAVPQYEQNLVNLIHDVRQEFHAPKLPVVIGELTGPWVQAPGEWAALRKAQAAAADRPEFHGNVTFVETRDFVRHPEDSPNPSHGHHEFGNAETYFLVGDALGKGMIALLTGAATPATKPVGSTPADPPQPVSRTARELEGWTIHVDDRLLESAHRELAARALKFLEAKLVEIKAVVPAERVKDLQAVTIVLDLTCGKLTAMQYHPDAGWLKANGFPTDLAKCVHLPCAADVATRRNINEQPWVILHELAHAFHDQQLGFDEARIAAAHEKFQRSGRGDAALLYNGKRVKHYALTNPMEFFAEMTEAYFGVNDFFPFNRAELQETEPEIFALLNEIWRNPKTAPGEAVRGE